MQILNLSATLNVVSLTPSINTYRLGEGVGTYNYNELNNKPSINNVTLQGNIQSSTLGIKTSDLTNDSGYISDADIPTATSDLTNDSGFVNATQVQTVVSNAIPSDISYFTNDVGYITDADIGNIPTRTSQLINDSGYITSAEAPVTSVNNLTGAVELDGTNIEYEQNVSINAKIDAVEDSIPTATSELTNDSGFITNASIPTRTSQLVNDSGFVNAQNIPVQSVNGQTGDVILTSEDLSYDGGTETVKDVIDEKADITALPFVKYEEINVALDNSGEGTLFTSNKFVIGIKDIPSDSLYVGYAVYHAGTTTKCKALSRNSAAFTSSGVVNQTRKVGVYYLDNISVT